MARRRFKPERANVVIKRLRTWGYGISSTVGRRVRVYRQHAGDGLPNKSVWKTEGRSIYLRCPGCARINKNSLNMLAFSRNSLVKPARKRFRTDRLAVINRCLACKFCRATFRNIVILGIDNRAPARNARAN